MEPALCIFLVVLLIVVWAATLYFAYRIGMEATGPVDIARDVADLAEDLSIETSKLRAAVAAAGKPGPK